MSTTDALDLLREVLAHPGWWGHDVFRCQQCDVPMVTWEETWEERADIGGGTWTETETRSRQMNAEELAAYRAEHPCDCGGADLERRATEAIERTYAHEKPTTQK
jgi:hypothetical protein